MKSYVLQKPKKLVLENLPSQSLASKSQIKVKIELASVTTTDLAVFNGTLKTTLPITLGRQAVGVISEVMPDNESRFQKGDRVIIEGFLPCGKCYYCKTRQPQKCENMRVLGYTAEGLFSDFVIVPQGLLHRIPDNMPYGTAVFTEFVSMALNVIDKLDLKTGDHVAIFSASKLGYILAQLVTYYQGIAIVIDKNAAQLEKMAAENINYTLNSSKSNWKENVRSITSGRMCEKVVYVTDSRDGFDDAIDVCGINGTICTAGFGHSAEKCDLARIHDKQLTLMSVKSSHGSFLSAINMLATKKINVSALMGDVFRFAEIPEKLLSATEEEVKYSSIQFRID